MKVIGATQKSVFLICPVRNLEQQEKERIQSYVSGLEQDGKKVHWPPRDTNQEDSVGLRICQDNREAIRKADEVHVWWNPSSQGSLFDVGMSFAMEKKTILANPEAVQSTPHKSFNNVLLALNLQRSLNSVEANSRI